MASKSEYGKAAVWATRHHEAPQHQGRYCVTVWVSAGTPDEYTELHDLPGYDHNTGLYFSTNFGAVVDDFGRLVRVQ